MTNSAKKPFMSIFGGMISIALFFIYISIIFYMVVIVIFNEQGNPINFGNGLTYVVTTIGGLVSALVIAKLALTEPGKSPTNMMHATDTNQNRTVTILVAVYLYGWIIAGLFALVVGVIVFPDTSKTLSDIGTTWLGLAVAAGYSFFGIEPNHSIYK